jgi:hypothetical protein
MKITGSSRVRRRATGAAREIQARHHHLQQQQMRQRVGGEQLERPFA